MSLYDLPHAILHTQFRKRRICFCFHFFALMEPNFTNLFCRNCSSAFQIHCSHGDNRIIKSTYSPLVIFERYIITDCTTNYNQFGHLLALCQSNTQAIPALLLIAQLFRLLQWQTRWYVCMRRNQTSETLFAVFNVQVDSKQINKHCVCLLQLSPPVLIDSFLTVVLSLCLFQ